MGSQSEPNGPTTRKPVLFFDIDNCLYPRSAKVYDLMADMIDKYFAAHLGLPEHEAVKLHRDYYRNYGLAIEGLVRHHQIDPLEYNAKVDDALPLEGIIKPDPRLRRLLEDVDTAKVKLWLFTNAYVTHGRRVVKLLGIDDLFDGLTYCDYAQTPIICKPHRDMFAKAMREAGVERAEDCYFTIRTPTWPARSSSAGPRFTSSRRACRSRKPKRRSIRSGIWSSYGRYFRNSSRHRIESRRRSHGV